MWDGFHRNNHLNGVNGNFLEAGKSSPQVFLHRSLLRSGGVRCRQQILRTAVFGYRSDILIWNNAS